MHGFGCATGQGYLFDRPLDEAALTARLAATHAPPLGTPA
jgi:EAL domain-containing protein (putative c-di-GMP-specific phosphodiesterase class I)